HLPRIQGAAEAIDSVAAIDELRPRTGSDERLSRRTGLPVEQIRREVRDTQEVSQSGGEICERRVVKFGPNLTLGQKRKRIESIHARDAIDQVAIGENSGTAAEAILDRVLNAFAVE